MDIPQGTAQFSNPEADSFLRKGFPGDMETKVAAIHEIDDNIAAQESAEAGARIGNDCGTHMYSIS